jgi:predicted MFS family arabinose efflux permease
VAIAVGPIVGGWLLENFSWNSIFFAMGPVAAVGFVLVTFCVPTSRDTDASRVDVPGLLLSTGAMASLVYTVIEAPTYGWGATRSIVGFAASALLFASFIMWERSVASPMLDVRLFRNLRFSAASSSVTVAFFTLLGFIFLMTQYFQFIRGYGPLSAGVHLLPVAVSVGIGSVVGTQLAVRFGTKLIVTLGLTAMAAFYIWVAASISTSIGYNVIAAQMVVYGLGMGLSSAPATESIMGAVSNRQAGIGSAVNDATRLLGGTLGVAIIGSVYASLYDARLTSRLPTHLPAQVSTAAHQSVGAALAAARHVTATGHPAIGVAVDSAATNAFIHGVSVGCLVAGGVAAAGAVVAAVFLPAQPPSAAAPMAEDRAGAESDPTLMLAVTR